MSKKKSNILTKKDPANIKQAICNFTIHDVNKNFLKTVDDKDEKKVSFFRTFFLTTLPRFLQFASFLNPLYNFGNIRTSIFISPILSSKSQSDLNQIITKAQNDSKIAEENKNYNKVESLNGKINEAESLRDEIDSGFNKLFEVSVLSTVKANDEHMLDIVSESLAIGLSSENINIRSCWGTQKNACTTNTPYNVNTLPERNNIFDIFGTACIFPFTSDTINHPKGFIYGFDKVTNKLILFNPFYNMLKNYNILMVGSTVAKKAFALNLLTLRSFTLSNLKTVCIDTDSNFENIAYTLIGVNIYISNDSNVIINPFDINSVYLNDEITGRKVEKVDLKCKAKELTSLIISMCQAVNNIDYPIDDDLYNVIYTNVLEEYQVLKISNSPESLYNSSKTELVNDEIRKAKKDFPTLSSWFKRIAFKKSKNDDPKLNNHYNYLIRSMKEYIKELNGKYSMFDGQTNVSENGSTPFINFNISTLDDTIKPIAQQLLLMWINDTYIKTFLPENEPSIRKRVIVDDASAMLKYKYANQIFSDSFDECKNREISLTMLINEYSAFEKNSEILELLNSCSIKFYMQQLEKDVDNMTDLFKLTEGESNFIRKASQVEGILVAGREKCQFHLDSVGYESDLI